MVGQLILGKYLDFLAVINSWFFVVQLAVSNLNYSTSTFCVSLIFV